jgi:hypothetical protein
MDEKHGGVKTIEIPLTERPPVRIVLADWPIIVDYANFEHEFVSNAAGDAGPWLTGWEVQVREHADGRKIVRAKYSAGADDPSLELRKYKVERGVLLLDTNANAAWAIKAICDEMAELECRGDDAKRWPTVCFDALSQLPPEDLV